MFVSSRSLCRAAGLALVLAACGSPAAIDGGAPVADAADAQDAALADDAGSTDATITDVAKPADADALAADAELAPDADAAADSADAADVPVPADAPDAGADVPVTDADADAPSDATATSDADAASAVEDAAADVGEEVADAGPDAGDAGSDLAADADAGATDATTDADADSDSAAQDAEVADAESDADAAAACTWFAPCVPTNPCHAGHWICPASGASCVDLNTNLADGAPCAGTGACVAGACQVCGGACTPSFSPCHVGIITCSGASATCTDTGANVADLTPCEGAFLCTAGACAPCTDFAPCMPADPCHTGYLTCGGGLAASCVDTAQPGADGIACGSGQTCSSGTCAAGPYTLAIFSGGGQSAWVDDDLASPVVLVLKDAGGKPLANAPLSVQAPEGAIATPASTLTDANGQASFALRLNLKVNPTVQFTANGPGGAQLPLVFAATGPVEGTIFAAVNRDGPSVEAMSGVGTQATLDQTRGLAVSSGGTVYFGEAGNGGFGNCYLKSLSPLGEMATLAGTGKCGFGGDGGPASAAQLTTASDIALDEAAGALYFADTGNNRVRRIDLASGVITTLAGGGTPTTGLWGDEGPASAAILKAPTRLSFGPAPLPATGNALYVSDDGHGTLRWIDSGGTIHLVLAPQTGDCAKDDLLFTGCSAGCDVAFGKSGELFFTGGGCGASTGTPENGLWTDVIFRRGADGSLSRAAGVYAYDTGDGTPANTSFVQADLLAMDPGGNLFFAGYQAQQVRRIDGRSGLVSTLAGGIGQYGTSGSYVPGPQAKLILPVGLALSPDLNLYFSDGNQVRVLWAVGHPLPSDVTLVDASDPLTAFALDAPFAGTRARVQQAPNAEPVPGVAVHWTAIDAGAGVRKPIYLTDTQGNSTPEGRVGLSAKMYTLRAEAFDIHQQPLPGSPVDLTIAATGVANDSIFGAFAVDPVGMLNGAATLANTVAVDVAASADGSLYIAGSCAVFAVRLPGAAELIAGDGVDCTFDDGKGIAANARLSPDTLALDDAKHLLYVGEFSTGRIAVVNLQTGSLATFAGGGTATAKPWGDGGLATDATLQTPNSLALGNGGLYIADAGRNQIRFVDGSGIISTLPVAQADCSWGTGCTAAIPGMCWPRDLAWDSADGQLLISAAACGPVAGDASAILSFQPGDTQAHWYAGATLGTGNSADGTPILGAEFGIYADTVSIGYDPGGVLHVFVAYSYDVRLRKIVDGKVYTVAGVQNPQPGASPGNYGPLSAAQFSYPIEFTFIPPGGLGKLAIIDDGMLRLVW